jgi:hypothetical protein
MVSRVSTLTYVSEKHFFATNGEMATALDPGTEQSTF